MLRFAFLNNESNPVGRLMLERLCRAKFVPQVVIEERSAFANRKTTAYLRSLKPDEIPPATEDIAARFEIPWFIVENLNQGDCQQLIRDYQSSLLILGNVRILGTSVLCLPRDGCINVHPGLLPLVRGAFPQCWSIVHNLPIGCTCHYVDEGVDTGPIISRREVEVFQGDTLEDIVARTMFTSADLLLEAATQLDSGPITTTSQIGGVGQTFHWPSHEIVEIAQERLVRGEYKHLLARYPRHMPSCSSQ